jgi:hypothetical protein
MTKAIKNRVQRVPFTLRITTDLMNKIAVEAGRLTAQSGRTVSLNAVAAACVEAQIAQMEPAHAVQRVAPAAPAAAEG